MNRREQERAICVITIGKEKKRKESKNKTTTSDTFVIRFAALRKIHILTLQMV